MTMHASRLALDALAGNHLAPGEASAVRAHVETCERCRADLASAEAAIATFTRDVLPRTVRRLRAPTPWWRRYLPIVAVPVVAAAALVLWLGRGEDIRSEDPDLRIKGATTFAVFAKRGDEVVPVRDGTRLRPGDAIRFVAAAREARYLLVVSIDGAGKPSLYHPYGGDRSAPIDALPSELPGSIVLDAAPGPERVFALFSTQPLEAAPVMRALGELGAHGDNAIRATHALDVGAQAQDTVVFEKELP